MCVDLCYSVWFVLFWGDTFFSMFCSYIVFWVCFLRKNLNVGGQGVGEDLIDL